MSLHLPVLGAKIADFTVNKFFYLWDVWTVCSMYVCICFLLPTTQISICVMQKAFILKIVNCLIYSSSCIFEKGSVLINLHSL